MTYALVALLGGTVGFLAGVVFRDAFDLYRASRKERRMPTSNHTVNRWLLTLVLVINAIVAVGLIWQRAESAAFVRCTAEWQSESQASSAARSEALTDTLKGLDEVMTAVDAGDRARFRRALNNYQDLRRDQIATQKAKPLPQPPERACGAEAVE